MRTLLITLMGAFTLAGCNGVGVSRLENEVGALRQRVQTLEQRVKRLETAARRQRGRGKAKAKVNDQGAEGGTANPDASSGKVTKLKARGARAKQRGSKSGAKAPTAPKP